MLKVLPTLAQDPKGGFKFVSCQWLLAYRATIVLHSVSAPLGLSCLHSIEDHKISEQLVASLSQGKDFGSVALPSSGQGYTRFAKGTGPKMNFVAGSSGLLGTGAVWGHLETCSAGVAISSGDEADVTVWSFNGKKGRSNSLFLQREEMQNSIWRRAPQ